MKTQISPAIRDLRKAHRALTLSHAVTIWCRAYTGEGVRENLACLRSDGVVLAWDAVADAWTTCHIIPGDVCSRVRAAVAAHLHSA